MARIRYLKPQAAEDVRLAECSRDARLLYRDLWCHMDRQGLAEDEPKLIKRNVFPYDDDLTASKVAKLIDELVSVGRLVRFVWNEHPLLYCPTLERHQNFHPDEKPKFRIPKDELEKLVRPTVDQLPTSFDGLASTTGTGNRNGEQELSTGKPAKRGFDFEAFWKSYPRKIAKADARDRFERLIRSQGDFDSLIDALTRFRAHHEGKGTEDRFIPYPATFLGTKAIPSWRDWLEEGNGKSDIRPAGEFVGLTDPDGPGARP